MLRRSFLGSTLGVAWVSAGAATDTAQLTVFAAASLKEAVDTINAAFALTGEPMPRASFAASAALARQLAEGAPADLFMSADEAWIDWLAERDLIVPQSRRALLGNTLVLVAPADSRIVLEDWSALPAALEGGRLAIGDPRSVPAGAYAREALEALGIWSRIADRVAPAENVRAALQYVARGTAPLGIVYRTDALAEPAVRIVAAFPAAIHRPIVYSVAAVRTSTAGGIDRYLAFLGSATACAAFTQRGFVVLD